jgi:hypothetical protein
LEKITSRTTKSLRIPSRKLDLKFKNQTLCFTSKDF